MKQYSIARLVGPVLLSLVVVGCGDDGADPIISDVDAGSDAAVSSSPIIDVTSIPGETSVPGATSSEPDDTLTAPIGTSDDSSSTLVDGGTEPAPADAGDAGDITIDPTPSGDAGDAGDTDDTVLIDPILDGGDSTAADDTSAPVEGTDAGDATSAPAEVDAGDAGPDQQL